MPLGKFSRYALRRTAENRPIESLFDILRQDGYKNSKGLLRLSRGKDVTLNREIKNDEEDGSNDCKKALKKEKETHPRGEKSHQCRKAGR